MNSFGYWFDYIVRNGVFGGTFPSWWVRGKKGLYHAYYNNDAKEKRIRVIRREYCQIFNKDSFDPSFMKPLISR